DYSYSEAMQKAGLTWTRLMLDRWIANPQAVVKGTKMLFAGLNNAAERKAIIDYLATLKN
ncbi:MAG TPA: cytochrome c family protein, partial [Stellaceae bacterium]|nr:cytochrome c family protein [Stellaceae bacterium]